MSTFFILVYTVTIYLLLAVLINNNNITNFYSVGNDSNTKQMAINFADVYKFRNVYNEIVGEYPKETRDSLMNSCNPALMQLGKRIGASTLYKYYDAFGFFDKISPFERMSSVHGRTIILNPGGV